MVASDSIRYVKAADFAAGFRALWIQAAYGRVMRAFFFFWPGGRWSLRGCKVGKVGFTLRGWVKLIRFASD